jgi:DNA-binding response OmpR family regulator
MVTRVLFADQSATIQTLAARAFAQEKIEVIKVGNGDLAMWLLDELNPHMVIADTSLPDTNGYELCHFIKHTPRLSHIPVLLLYWSDESFDFAKANGALADAHMSKPFESRTLIEAVHKLIQDAGEAREPSALPLAPARLEDDSPGNVEPPDTREVYEEAQLDSSSGAIESEPPVLIAVEESPTATDSLLEAEPTLEPAASEEAPHALPPDALASPASVEYTEAISYAAPEDRLHAINSTDLRPIEQRPIKSPLAWAVLAIIALSAILGIWQATRIKKTRPAVTTVENGPQEDKHSQASSPSSSDPRLELPPPSESSEGNAFDFGAASEQDQLLSPRPAARSVYPRSSSLNRKDDLEEKIYQWVVANNRRAANNNRSDDLKARIPTQTKPANPPEPIQASTSPPKNDKPEPSPVRIIPVDVPGAAAAGKMKPGAASKQGARTANGFEQIGSGVKGAVVWTGRKAGRGIKAIARELKRAFKPDPRRY